MPAAHRHTLRRRLVVTVAAAVGAAAIAPAPAGAQEVIFIGPDDALVALPIEPDEPPPRPEVPRPAPPAPPVAAEVEPTGDDLSPGEGDVVTRLTDRARAPLAAVGLTPGASYTADWAHNVRGGASTNGSAFVHLVNVNLTLDPEPLLGWRGATVFANVQSEGGESADADAGDFQGVSSIAADGRTQVSELWVEQRLWDERLRLKVGKVDAGGEFGYALNGGEFVNASINWTATNAVMPTYPDPAFGLLGAAASVAPVEGLYVTAGAFDGALQEGVPTGSRGPDTLFGPPADTYLAVEAGLTWTGGDAGRVGRLAVGAWHHTGTFDRLAGGTRDGASGGYVVLDQTLVRENPDAEDDAQGLGAFAILDAADDEVFETDWHVAAGLAWTGLLDGRDADVIGLGATWIHFSPDAGFPGDGELTVEAFYRLQLTPWFSVKPDVQYIANPSGGAADDALVATLRVEAAF